MRFYGRSKTEQFGAYKAVLDKAERVVFYKHLHEVVNLLERFERSHGDMMERRHDDPDDFYNLRREAGELLKALDDEMLKYLFKNGYLTQTDFCLTKEA